MYTIESSSLGQFLHTFWTLVWGVFALDPEAFRTVQMHPQLNWVIVAIVFCAGVSQALGQSVVLFVNRVKPARFFLSLLVSGLIFVLGVLIQLFTIWLIAHFIFRVPARFGEIARTVGLGYAPLLWSFFILLPYTGSLLDHIFDVWSLLAIIVAVSVVTQLPFLQVLCCTLGGWLVFELAKFTIGRPLMTLVHWFRNSAAGVPLNMKMRDVSRTIGRGISDQSH